MWATCIYRRKTCTAVFHLPCWYFNICMLQKHFVYLNHCWKLVRINCLQSQIQICRRLKQASLESLFTKQFSVLKQRTPASQGLFLCNFSHISYYIWLLLRCMLLVQLDPFCSHMQGEKNPTTCSMGLEKHWKKKHLLCFIYALPHSVSPLLNQALHGYCNTSNNSNQGILVLWGVGHP